jgi:NAD dependent epimerase/dehydratase
MKYRQRVTWWQGRRVLVTGGGGFIGGHLAVALVAAGASVRALCRYNSRGDRGTLDWFDPGRTAEIEVVFGDLRDPESAQQAMAGIEIAFHLGAQIAIPYSYVNPRDFVMTNVVGTLNVAQAALQADVQRLVQMSTSEVYGEPRTWPITPDHPVSPRSPYAASKAGADLLVQSLHASFDLPVVIARAFNTYGPHQSARAIVPTIATQAVQGDRIKLGALDPRRDLTFVTDTVSGLMAIAAAPDVVHETLQLGSGHDVSIAELVTLIGELTGRELQVELDPQRVRPPDSEVSRLLCDYGATRSLTGWAPSVDLRDGLARTLESIRRDQHRYRAGEYAT